MTDKIYKITNYEDEKKHKIVMLKECINDDSVPDKFYGYGRCVIKMGDGKNTRPIDYTFSFPLGLSLEEAFANFDEYAEKDKDKVTGKFKTMIREKLHKGM